MKISWGSILKLFIISNMLLFILITPFNSCANKHIDMKDIYWLANNIYHESRGENIYGQLMVGIVTLSRLDSGKWGNSIYNIVSANKQFSWYRKDKNISIYSKKDLIKFKNIAILSIILYDYSINHNIQYYHSNKIKPYWAKDMKIFDVIGNHTFYYK